MSQPKPNADSKYEQLVDKYTALATKYIDLVDKYAAHLSADTDEAFNEEEYLDTIARQEAKINELIATIHRINNEGRGAKNYDIVGQSRSGNLMKLHIIDVGEFNNRIGIKVHIP